MRVQLTRYVGASFDEIPVFDEPQRLELSVDGAPVHVFELLPQPPAEGRGYGAGQNRRGLDADWQIRFPAKAGPRTVALTFLNRAPALLENLLEPFDKPVPGGPNGYYTTQKGAYLRSVEISGPYDATGPGDTPSRERIFVCRPTAPADEAACAKKILSTLARRAFRRPVDEADMQTLLSLYKEGRARRAASSSASSGRSKGCSSVRNSCIGSSGSRRAAAKAGRIYRISDLELASRLSFFLWSSIPDDALLDVAASGKLREPRMSRAAGAAHARRSASRRRRQ